MDSLSRREPANRDARDRFSAEAEAGANVALVKYWGKRDDVLNLPAVGSISLTLAELRARARVTESAPGSPRFLNRGIAVEGVAAERMARFLDFVGSASGLATPLRADIDVSFPVAAGLASSAAIYCAIAAAVAAASGSQVSSEQLSIFARRGSGSAARSVHGGFAEWFRGEREDGSDSYAIQLLPETDWPLAMAVAVTSDERKAISSRDAMRHVRATSALYPAWIETQEEDLVAARRAIDARDLAALGRIAEENCLRMHATCLGARPPVLFWGPATIAAMVAVRELRDQGYEAFFTIDAGPQVKVLCRARDLSHVAARMAVVPGVLRVLEATPGPGVRLLSS